MRQRDNQPIKLYTMIRYTIRGVGSRLTLEVMR